MRAWVHRALPQLLAALLLLAPAFACAAPLNYRAIAFYYNWYGDVAHDGAPLHWAHDVLRENACDTTSRRIPGNGDIAANFYPQLGEYSSADPAVIERHMAMIARARIGVIAVTWLGADDPSFRSVDPILAAAARHGIKVCFQIEPKVRRSAVATAEAIRELIGRYGARPAFYRDPDSGRPLFFVYDSYVIPAREWAEVLSAPGPRSIRGTMFDADVLGLWVGAEAQEQPFFETSGFDGFYTYFASRGFTWGSTPEHWPQMQRWAARHGKLFVPSVGPGYVDTRVRPWNARNTRDRAAGRYYDDLFSLAIASGSPFVGITSFNEWHEGTQIEPAVPRAAPFAYLDYRPRSPDYFLRRTAHWLRRFPGGRPATQPPAKP